MLIMGVGGMLGADSDMILLLYNPATYEYADVIGTYLYRYGLVQPDRKNVFIQGEHMRRPSEIRSRLTVENGDALIRVGGRAVLSLSGEIYAD